MKVGKEIYSLSKLSTNIVQLVRPKSKLTKVTRLAFLGVVFLNIMLLPINTEPQVAIVDAAQSPTDVWWPTDGAHLIGMQPFKAMVGGLDVSQYEMFWQVDGGQLNGMQNSYSDYQHKEVVVDVGGWNWHGSGPYTLTFVAKKDGITVAQKSESIYIDNGLPVYQSTVSTSEPTTVAATNESYDLDPVHQAQKAALKLTVAVPVVEQVTLHIQPTVSTNSSALYADPYSPAATQASAWRDSRPNDAAKMDILAAQPTAKWFGGWSGDIQSAVNSYVTQAASAGKVPVTIAYNVPQRDCGGYSAGGTSDYTNWIGGFSRGIGSHQAIVILEPDALAQMSCLSASDQQNRYQLLSSAVSILKANSNTKVYIDAGHSNWIDAGAMADMLNKSDINQADGFALNVSNFMSTGDEVNFGSQISSKIGGKHFVVDTSRNGSGSNGQWCNPSGMTIGQKPTTNTGNPIVDAYLWLKTPGESDGNCNGGPNAGVWWPDYALSLVK